MVEEESAACNSIANCNCSGYSYHSVARFGSASHQKHWHRKHLRWAPEQRRVPFLASTYNPLVTQECCVYLAVVTPCQCGSTWHGIIRGNINSTKPYMQTTAVLAIARTLILRSVD